MDIKSMTKPLNMVLVNKKLSDFEVVKTGSEFFIQHKYVHEFRILIGRNYQDAQTRIDFISYQDAFENLLVRYDSVITQEMLVALEEYNAKNNNNKNL